MNEVSDFGSQVMVIDEEGKNRGKMVISEALRLAEGVGLDLVKVSHKDNMSVCKIVDRGKWQYEQRKKAKQKTLLQHHSKPLKEVKFRINIHEHDLQTKVSHIERFLEKGHSVKIAIQLKGRERSTLSLADDKLEHILATVKKQHRKDSIKKSNIGTSVIIHPINLVKNNGKKV